MMHVMNSPQPIRLMEVRRHELAEPSGIIDGNGKGNYELTGLDLIRALEAHMHDGEAYLGTEDDLSKSASKANQSSTVATQYVPVMTVRPPHQ